MVGLGPKGTSLLERTGHRFELTEDWLILDRQERSQTRKLARIKWSMKKKKAQKPVAPVEETREKKANEREWLWVGETLIMKGLIKGELIRGSLIRSAGFKLPKLNKKEGKKHG